MKTSYALVLIALLAGIGIALCMPGTTQLEPNDTETVDKDIAELSAEDFADKLDFLKPELATKFKRVLAEFEKEVKVPDPPEDASSIAPRSYALYYSYKKNSKKIIDLYVLRMQGVWKVDDFIRNAYFNPRDKPQTDAKIAYIEQLLKSYSGRMRRLAMLRAAWASQEMSVLIAAGLIKASSKPDQSGKHDTWTSISTAPDKVYGYDSMKSETQKACVLLSHHYGVEAFNLLANYMFAIGALTKDERSQLLVPLLQHRRRKE